MELLYGYLAIINAVTMTLMLADKLKARKKRWRIPERVLLLLCAAGGSLGGYLGMHLFRHKTRHPPFSIGIPVMLAVHTVLIILLATR